MASSSYFLNSNSRRSFITTGQLSPSLVPFSTSSSPHVSFIEIKILRPVSYNMEPVSHRKSNGGSTFLDIILKTIQKIIFNQSFSVSREYRSNTKKIKLSLFSCLSDVYSNLFEWGEHST